MYNLSTSKETEIAINVSDSVFYSSIYGYRVLWEDTHRGKSFIRVYNISTGRIINITKSKSADVPNIYGDRIVWRNYRHGGNDIYMATLINPPFAACSTSTLCEKKIINS